MNPHDLTPAGYARRSGVRKALRRWSLLTALCVALAALPIAIGSTRMRDDAAASAQERLEQAQGRLDQAHTESRMISTSLQQHQRELQASQRLTRRPDWSRVLMLVAGQMDEKLMMTGVHLGQVNDSKVRSVLGTLSLDVPGDSVWLILSGVAESNSDVPGLIMRLENLGLFDRVVMTGTQREAFAGSPRTVFTLACRVQ